MTDSASTAYKERIGTSTGCIRIHLPRDIPSDYLVSLVEGLNSFVPFIQQNFQLDWYFQQSVFVLWKMLRPAEGAAVGAGQFNL